MRLSTLGDVGVGYCDDEAVAERTVRRKCGSFGNG